VVWCFEVKINVDWLGIGDRFVHMNNTGDNQMTKQDLNKICVEVYKGYNNFVNDVAACSFYCDTVEQADAIHDQYCGMKSYEGLYYYTAS